MSLERIDETLCNGCGTCVDTCPMDVIRLDTIGDGFSRQSPCRVACPAGIDIRTSNYLVKNDMVDQAARVIRQRNPFPSITGRVCPHPCEGSCARAQVDQAVNINALEHYVASESTPEDSAPSMHRDGKIAVVGSGPAGLSCAYYLNGKGYDVVVYEASAAPGGMLRYAIPSFRLPEQVIDGEVRLLANRGVEFRCGITVGAGMDFSVLLENYDAVFWATGKQKPKKMEFPGSDLAGIYYALDFLKDVKTGACSSMQGNVIVVGGGDTAVDAALSALMLGAASVKLAYRKTRDRMPASPEEILRLKEAGIEVIELVAPMEARGVDGRMDGMVFARCDEHGNRLDTVAFEVDAAIFAIGQEADVSLFPEGVSSSNGFMDVRSACGETNLSGLFAGGDVVQGTNLVVEAIADGRRAAEAIDRYICGDGADSQGGVGSDAGDETLCAVENPPCKGIRPVPRRERNAAPDSGVGCARWDVPRFDDDDARIESSRCMTCGSVASVAYPEACMLCTFCEMDCPQGALWVSPDKLENPLMPWG